MGGFEVAQRTKDGMFNATTLLKQWNENAGMRKEVTKYFENPSTKEFISTIANREFTDASNSLTITDTQKTAIGDNQTFSRVYVKQRGGLTGGGSTWMHPLLFIDFAMWINPAFKYDVLKFVYDELLKFRNDAGDAYREMSTAISKIVAKKDLIVSLSKIAEGLNWVAFNEHETAIRNRKGENEMKGLVEIEKEVTLLINVGHLGTFADVLKYLRESWKKKYSPPMFAIEQ